MRVLKYLRGHIPAVALIVLLLVAQSFCELSLPAYTSRIVDTGIQGGGIESATPLVLTDKTMDGVRLFLSDEDAQTVSDAYTYDNGIWTLGDRRAYMTSGRMKMPSSSGSCAVSLIVQTPSASV